MAQHTGGEFLMIGFAFFYPESLRAVLCCARCHQPSSYGTDGIAYKDTNSCYGVRHTC